MYRLISILVLIMFGYALKAEIIITGFDISKYPEIKGEFYLYNNSPYPSYMVNQSQFEVLDNSNPAIVKQLNIPILNNFDKVSTNIMVDLAIDYKALPSKLNTAQLFANELINLIPNSSGDIAISSFDKIPYLNCELTNDKAKLIKSLNMLSLKSISQIENAFIASPGGGIDIVKHSLYEKSIVLISDGNKDFPTEKIILMAKAAGVRINCVTLDQFAGHGLKTIAYETGGRLIENLSITNYKENAKLLVSSLYNYKPIEIIWNNQLDCEKQHSIIITNKVLNISGSKEIMVPDTNMPALQIDNPYLKFSAVIPGNTKEMQFTVTARNKDITITRIGINPGIDFTISNGWSATPLKIPQNQSHTFTIKNSPTDSNIIFAVLSIESDACFGKDVYLSGGFPNRPPKDKIINITNPNGGEILVAGDTCRIKWYGMMPSDIIQLEYSVNDGNRWDTLAQDVSGLEYNWTVPLITGKHQTGVSAISKECLARIVQLWPNNVGETLDLKHRGIVYAANFSKKEGESIITACHDGIARLWNSYTGAVLKEYKRESSNSPMRWANFNNAEDKIVTCYEDGFIIVWDKLSANVLHKIKAHNSIVYSANFSNNDSLIASTSKDKYLRIWRVADGVKLQEHNNKSSTQFAIFNKNNDKVFYSDINGKVNLYSLMSKIIIDEYYDSDYNFDIVCVALNKDETRLAAAHGGESKVSVWDVNSKKRLFQMSHDPNSLVNFVAYGVDPITNAELILSASNDYTARKWDASNGNSLAILNEHTNNVTMAQFNFDGSRILSSSTDSTAKVWNLNKRDLQMDTSDTNFEIVKAELNYHPVVIPKTATDEIRYAVIDTLISNPLKSDFPITAIFITGRDANDFTIIDGVAPYRIDSAETKGLSLAFAPKGKGIREAIINVVIPYDTIRIPLTGEGYDVGIIMMVNSVNMGNVESGDYKDSTITTVIKNRTLSRVRISNVSNIGPNIDNFVLLSDLSNTELEPGETKPITIRYYADKVGFDQGVLTFEYNYDGSPTNLSVYGRTIDPIINSAILSCDNISGKPGEIIDLPIRFIKENSFTPKANGIATEIEFNSTLLEPLDKSLLYEINDNVGRLYLNIPTNFSNEIITNLKFKVGLGNDTISPIRFNNTAMVGNDKTVLSTRNSEFKLTGLCYDGGTRLIDPNGGIVLNPPNPNPVRSRSTINFKNLVSGNVNIYISDISGRIVKSLVNTQFSAGEHSVELSAVGIPAGIYFYTYETSYTKQSVRFEVIK